jgi:tRNA A37 threonylcarbamoyltransferase TsaD
MKPPKTLAPKEVGLSLYIDTTVLNEIFVAVVSSQKVTRLTKSIGLKQRDDLLTYVDQLIRRSKTSFNKIKSIIVVRGPGPFTATRVGVAVANALGLALNIPIYGIKKTGSIDIAKLVNMVNLLPAPKTPIRPYYDRPPNITKPKNKVK